MKMYDEGEAHLQDVTWQGERKSVLDLRTCTMSSRIIRKSFVLQTPRRSTPLYTQQQGRPGRQREIYAGRLPVDNSRTLLQQLCTLPATGVRRLNEGGILKTLFRFIPFLNIT